MLDAHHIARQIKRAGKDLWRRLPLGLKEQAAVRHLNELINRLSRKYSSRRHAHDAPTTTRFLRYPPLVMTICDLINDFEPYYNVHLCVLGCSTGAELYTVLWAIRKTRSDLKVLSTGVDLSAPAIEKARVGQYSMKDEELSRLSEASCSELFDAERSVLKIKPSLRTGVEWIVGDICDDALLARLGLQDIVIANNFLMFMKEPEAANCLRNILKLVKPGGLLLCRGVDLDVREQVVQQFGLRPILNRIEEIHNDALDARRGWPWEYWGLEPLDKTRKGWVRRYATVFQVPSLSHASTTGALSDERYAVVAPIHCKQL